MSDNDYVLELSTTVLPGQKFSVDGDEYEMANPDSLSEDDESRVMGKFALHARTARRLDNARNETEARRFAKELRRSRIGLLVELTNLPNDVATKLPISAQNALIESISEALGVVADVEPESAEPAGE